MNREERREIAMRVRRGIASEEEQDLFGRLGKARGQSGWHPHKAYLVALRAIPIRPVPEDGPSALAKYRREMNARKRARRARR